MITPTILYNLTPIQRKYINDYSHRFYVVPPGRRSRKTLISSFKVLYTAMRVPNTRYFQAAPTRRQAKEIFWDNLIRNTAHIRDGMSKSELKIYLKNGSSIQIEGLDRSERLEGSPWDGGHITETGNTKPDFWDAHLRPCFADTARIENGVQLGYCIFDGTPEGTNHYYDFALLAANGVIPETKPRVGAFAENDEWAYYHWFSEDVLSKKEIESAKRRMDARMFTQEFKGSFLSFEGRLYYSFDAKDHVNDAIAQYRDTEPIHLSCDFNKTPMAWVVGQKRNGMGLIVDEVVTPFNAKTQQTAQEFCNRFSGHQNRTVYLTGDAANNFESIRDFTTDYVLIQDVLRANGWIVKTDVPNYNPSVNNRVLLGCSLFRPITGKPRMYINSKCTWLKADFEKNESDGKGGKNKDDKNQTHASDSFDYLTWKWFSSEINGTQMIQGKR